MTSYFRALLVFLGLSLAVYQAHSQVLISLLFGDALNSDKIEFGLEGGFNRSYLFDVPDSKGLNSFNLGFYFHIKIKENSFISTGVRVKSNVGARGMSTYPIGDPEFDQVFENAELIQEINYFYVPVMYQYRFNQRIIIEGGFQLGLRNRAFDIFETEDLDGEISYKTDTRDQYKRFDAGLIGGLGYKWKKRLKSMSTGLNYYHGLMNVSAVEGVTRANTSVYLYVKVPIGAGSKENIPTDN